MRTRTCLECGTPFKSRQYNSEFDTAVCKAQFNNRRASRGTVLYDLLMVAATDANRTADFSDRATAYIAEWIIEDEMRGRPRTTKSAQSIHFDTISKKL